MQLPHQDDEGEREGEGGEGKRESESDGCCSCFLVACFCEREREREREIEGVCANMYEVGEESRAGEEAGERLLLQQQRRCCSCRCCRCAVAVRSLAPCIPPTPANLSERTREESREGKGVVYARTAWTQERGKRCLPPASFALPLACLPACLPARSVSRLLMQRREEDEHTQGAEAEAAATASAEAEAEAAATAAAAASSFRSRE